MSSVVLPQLSDTDAAILADVIAFLDDVEVGATADWASEPPFAPADSSCAETLVKPAAPKPRLEPKPLVATGKRRPGRPPSLRPHQSKADPKNRARVEKYWQQKRELRALKDEVEILTAQVDELQSRAVSAMEVEVTSALCIMIRSTYRAAFARMAWKRRAGQEQQVRRHAEKINAELRQLVRKQKQWVDDLNECMQQSPAIPAKVLSTDVGPRVSLWSLTGVGDCNQTLDGIEDASVDISSEMHNTAGRGSIEDARIAILRRVYQEAWMLANIGAVVKIEQLDWSGSSGPETHVISRNEWTTTFTIPVGNPRSVGDLWWSTYYQLCKAPDSGTVSLTVRDRLCFNCLSSTGANCSGLVENQFRDGDVPRLEKKSVWSVPDEDQQEVHFTGLTVFEIHNDQTSWILAVTFEVYDSTGEALLFRASAWTVATQAEASSTLVRACYRIHDIDCANATLVSRAEVLRSKGMADCCNNCLCCTTTCSCSFVIDSWGSKTRREDRLMQQLFLQG